MSRTEPPTWSMTLRSRVTRRPELMVKALRPTESIELSWNQMSVGQAAALPAVGVFSLAYSPSPFIRRMVGAAELDPGAAVEVDAHLALLRAVVDGGAGPGVVAFEDEVPDPDVGVARRPAEDERAGQRRAARAGRPDRRAPAVEDQVVAIVEPDAGAQPVDAADREGDDRPVGLAVDERLQRRADVARPGRVDRRRDVDGPGRDRRRERTRPRRDRCGRRRQRATDDETVHGDSRVPGRSEDDDLQGVIDRPGKRPLVQDVLGPERRRVQVDGRLEDPVDVDGGPATVWTDRSGPGNGGPLEAEGGGRPSDRGRAGVVASIVGVIAAGPRARVREVRARFRIGLDDGGVVPLSDQPADGRRSRCADERDEEGDQDGHQDRRAHDRESAPGMPAVGGRLGSVSATQLVPSQNIDMPSLRRPDGREASRTFAAPSQGRCADHGTPLMRADPG